MEGDKGTGPRRSQCYIECWKSPQWQEWSRGGTREETVTSICFVVVLVVVIKDCPPNAKAGIGTVLSVKNGPVGGGGGPERKQSQVSVLS